MSNKKKVSLKQVLKKSEQSILVYAFIFNFVVISIVLSNLLISSEKSKLKQTVNQLSAIVKSSIQIGDEIEIRNILVKTLETSSVVNVDVVGDNIMPINISKNKKYGRDKGTLFDFLFSNFITQKEDFYIYENSKLKYSMAVTFPNFVRGQILLYAIFSAILIAAILMLILRIHLKMVLIRVVNPIDNLTYYIEGFNARTNASYFSKNNNLDLVEVRKIKESFDLLQNKNKKLYEKLLKNKIDEEAIKIASQVAHDIRSPLTALNVVSKDLASLSENSRVLLRSSIHRIQDIANNLVSQSSEKVKEKESIEKQNLESNLLLPIIEEIVSEKRYQLRSRAGVNVTLDGEKAYGLFAKVNDSSLKRIISNLINNSVEAFDDSGEVVVTVSDNEKNNTEVLLSIKDNGKGISKDILPKLAQRGISFGKDTNKESGSGLGLYHAKNNIEQWGGRFLIESEEGKGTEVKLYLPKAKAPTWFVPAIHLKGIKNIVILDDDESIHQVWDRRLRKYIDKYAINLQHARSPEDFKKLTEGQKSLLCLCDYELLGFEDTGLDLIEDNGLEDVSILVTSRYAEEKVQERCEKMGVKLIPKTSADLVPFNVEEVQRKTQYDAVLIDDDPLIHSVWKMRVRDTDKSILMFEDPKVFYQKVDEISKQTPIYIDQNLSDGQLGTEVAKTIASLGFKKLYLATGEEKSSIKVKLKDDVNIFVDIVGKDVPWD
ncbi:HAMP domain-containing histidine kinase [bacterium]|nr:HAMP domain-containing histidine kinase [bacterium]